MTLKRQAQQTVPKMDARVLGPLLVTESMLPDAETAKFSAEEVAEAYGLE